MKKKKKPPSSTATAFTDLMGLKRGDGMVGGNQTKGGLRFGPKTSSTPRRPFGAGYGGGGTLGTPPGYLGPRNPNAPTKKGTK